MSATNRLLVGHVRLLRFSHGCDQAPHAYRLSPHAGRFAICLGCVQLRFGRPR